MYIYQIERELIHRGLTECQDVFSGVVVDAGCGSGSRYAKIFPLVSKWIRLDSNPDYKPDIVASVTEIPLEDAVADGVLCTQVIGDVLHPQLAINEFARILKPGGVLILTEGFLNEIHGEPGDYYRFTPYGLAALCAYADLTVERTVLTGGWASVGAQAVTRIITRTLRLYERPRLGKVMSPFFHALGAFSRLMDRIIRGDVNRFGLTSIVIAKKPIA